MYVCVCICMYMYIYIRDIRLKTAMHTRMRNFRQEIYTYFYVCVYIRRCMYVYIYMYIYMHGIYKQKKRCIHVCEISDEDMRVFIEILMYTYLSI